MGVLKKHKAVQSSRIVFIKNGFKHLRNTNSIEKMKMSPETIVAMNLTRCVRTDP